MKDPKTLPVIRIELLIDGALTAREWTMDEAPPPDTFDTVPDCVVDRRKSWDHPQDPVTYSGRVEPGGEQEAIDWLASL